MSQYHHHLNANKVQKAKPKGKTLMLTLTAMHGRCGITRCIECKFTSWASWWHLHMLLSATPVATSSTITYWWKTDQPTHPHSVLSPPTCLSMLHCRDKEFACSRFYGHDLWPGTASPASDVRDTRGSTKIAHITGVGDPQKEFPRRF